MRRADGSRLAGLAGRCSASGGQSSPAVSQCSGRQATTSRAPFSRSQSTVPVVHRASRCARTGGISSGPSSRTSSGLPASAASRATRSGVAAAMSPRAPAAVTMRPACPSVRTIASATEVSSASRSAPRSHSVRAGTWPRARRAASAASSVVRPVPGSPTRPRTTAPRPSGFAGPHGGEGAELRGGLGPFHRIGPTAVSALGADGHGGQLERSGQVQIAAVAGDAHGVAPQQLAQRPPSPAPASGTAHPAAACPARRAVPRTAMTAPVSGSRTGPPTAAPPSRSASLPSVPRASSRARPIRWAGPPAVYVTGTGPRTRASRQPCAAIVT